jgi:hypothetical protein
VCHGLGESGWVVHVAWVFLCLGISHFDLVWLSSFSFLHLMRCHVGIGCCKMGGFVARPDHRGSLIIIQHELSFLYAIEAASFFF